ncbi:unnamed protein product [Blumeria hordei]|uniref:Uncharacterized protein n=1 Tax=Blumeria hordei TaxID=2867405 RepID=A0A383UK18_BLUHO|nr:unnamed protein product [Blumeria hordei]
MAALFSNLFLSSPSPTPIAIEDSDFADFAEVPEPTRAAILASSDENHPESSSQLTDTQSIPFTKWYNVHERHSLGEFKQEGVIIVLLLFIVLIHLFGTKINRKKAKKLMGEFGPILHKEFSLLGFETTPTTEHDEWQAESVHEILKEKSPSEFSTYATGRQNVAFIDIDLTLLKRYSPLTLMAEAAMSVFFEGMSAPSEHVGVTLYPFDGKEHLLVPGQIPGSNELRKGAKSTYDGFVWAVVNKDNIKQLRDDRYDISLTSTKDSSKLPKWTTVMSESAEITEALLTPELIRAIEQSGDLFNHLIITDQPVEQPLKLEDTTPRKRISLSLKIPSSNDYSSVLNLLQYVLNLTDLLVQHAHFRPEVLRKVKSARDDAIRKIQKADEEEKAEQRNLEREKAKKQKRNLELQALDSKAQKKYLEREKEKGLRKNQKKIT